MHLYKGGGLTLNTSGGVAFFCVKSNSLTLSERGAEQLVSLLSVVHRTTDKKKEVF